MTERIGDWSGTFTGKSFYPFDPRPEDICAEDIAHSLSMLCRFGGHSSEMYSVADHSLRVSDIVPPEFALQALLHELAEAYIVDLPSPVKCGLPEYIALEKKILAVGSLKFCVDLVNLPECVKHADRVLLATERRDLMPKTVKPWRGLPDPLPARIRPMTPAAAKAAFLRRLDALLSNRAHDTDRAPPGEDEIPTLVECVRPPVPKLNAEQQADLDAYLEHCSQYGGQ